MFLRLLLIILIIFINSCSKKEEKISIIKEKQINLQMIDAYKEGIDAFEKGDALFAAKKFNEAEILFPQSKWASRSVLMAAYAYYSQDYYFDAISELGRFIQKYPKHERLNYAHFLLAICHYEQIVDEKKDLGPLLNAQEEFKFVIKNYPESDFALDSKFKLDLINDVLASKEIFLGRYYMKKQKWIAAINRFKQVVEVYSTTVYIEESLHRLVELHYRIGLIDEAKKYASLLGYNYQSSQWYEATYIIFNKDYESSINKINKKKGNFIIRKFKSLFEL
ncbi:MAG TPA: outer membrane protein assembly factor BamD [Candidatus Pelagibacter bacterium]|jgi:outer membrane protein assembly factor BamD|nr:outer membrane protein assembly factor BamD [Pelagibacteraceae bacterium]HJN84667.1 outer membrane protein assembly factor BamD [Candidatus Pelagibacter bacterium]|tara:strand:- start:647 stop:1483 length:837 start_codon:yes stop_codon:yes gene_type:complete